MSETLYERLGGNKRVAAIASDLVDLHMKNPRIAQRFSDIDLVTTKQTVTDFFSTGTGGPNVYKGKDMIETHKGMNIDNDEFMAVLDDAMQALELNNVGQREKEEVLYILFSMKAEVTRQ